MKRILLSLFVAIIGLGAVAEDDVTGNARSMRTQIVNYIRNEGYNPSVDDDGDIMFRYEGDNYYIQCQNYGDEVYVRTFSDMSTDESPINRVRRAADFGQNEYKFVRVLVLDGFIRTECVVSINTLSEYKRRFRSYLTIIQEVEKEIKNNYNDEQIQPASFLGDCSRRQGTNAAEVPALWVTAYYIASFGPADNASCIRRRVSPVVNVC